MTHAAPQLDTLRCKHCTAVLALVSRAAIVGRTPLRCPHCGVIRVVWPKKTVDAAPARVYSEGV